MEQYETLTNNGLTARIFRYPKGRFFAYVSAFLMDTIVTPWFDRKDELKAYLKRKYDL